jgi:hypothetical protein
MIMAKCFYCGKEIEGSCRIIALDRPVYVNVKFHPECLRLIENVEKYLGEDKEKLYEYASSSGIHKRRSKSKVDETD